jgi:uncharacterized protein (TIGR00255 family)
MTGFGRGVAEKAGVRATVDVRSVNHRFLDLKLRGPLAPATEDAIATRVRATLERGAVTVSVNVVRAAGGGVRLDADAARQAHAALAELARTLGTEPPGLGLVLAQPGVVAAASEDDRESDEVAIVSALEAALAQLAQMRAREGEALARELAARLADLARLRATIEQAAANVPDQLQRRLRDRLDKLLRDESVEPARLAQEVALLADRADVTEELVRLASHLEQARELIAATAPAGRRLDFLAQELGRELNTIGSKSASAEITAAVVEAKAVLEKLREQVQNVE